MSKVVATTACPSCFAGPGQPCNWHSVKQELKGFIHQSRIQLHATQTKIKKKG